MKVYYFKSDLESYQIFPTPANLEDFIVVEVSDVSELECKVLVKNGESYKLVDKPTFDCAKWDSLKNAWVLDESLVAQAILDKKEQLTVLSESKTEQLIKSIPKFTSKTEQRMEAVLYKIDNSYPVPHLSSIARKLNIPLAEVVENTLREQDKEADKRGGYVADDAIFKNRIDAATTLDELEKIEQDIQNWK